MGVFPYSSTDALLQVIIYRQTAEATAKRLACSRELAGTTETLLAKKVVENVKEEINGAICQVIVECIDSDCSKEMRK